MSREEQVLNRLRELKERLTIQRRLVIEALCRRNDHMTIQDIRQVVGQGYDLPDPTIYRILQWLKDLQLVSQTDIGDGGIVYELIGDPPHHHLICLQCGHVTDIDDHLFAELRQRLRDEHGFAARIEHMAIYGQCEACRS